MHHGSEVILARLFLIGTTTLFKEKRLKGIAECLRKEHHHYCYLKTSAVNPELVHRFIRIVIKQRKEDFIRHLVKYAGNTEQKERKRISEHAFHKLPTAAITASSLAHRRDE